MQTWEADPPGAGLGWIPTLTKSCYALLVSVARGLHSGLDKCAFCKLWVVSSPATSQLYCAEKSGAELPVRCHLTARRALASRGGLGSLAQMQFQILA